MKNGFSLIELMITILILGIVVAFGAPSFTNSIQSNRLTSQTNAMTGAISFVRTEAVKLNGNVTICGSSDQANCNTSDWELGWIIFVDSDGNSTRAGTEAILRVGEPLTGGNTLSLDGFGSTTAVRFGSDGRITSSGTFIICDDRGAEEALGIVVNISGQTRVASDEDTPADSIVNAHDGGDVACI